MTDITTPQAGLAPPSSDTTIVGPIVVAVGGEDPDSVLRAASILAPASAAGVLAVSVLAPILMTAPGESAWVIPPGHEEERFADAKARLGRHLDPCGDAAASWSRKVVRGAPASVLGELARHQHASMLVVGIGRHRLIDRIFGAETALRVIQHASCPVLVVHPDFVGPFHDVVVATDFSRASAAAAQAVMPLLSPAATIHVVHVWEPRDALDPRREALDEAYAKSLPERLQRFIELLTIPPGVAFRTAVREGRAAERVLDYARAHHADLITAGRHGRNLLERLLVGSQTTALMRAADRSLLITPAPPFADDDEARADAG